MVGTTTLLQKALHENYTTDFMLYASIAATSTPLSFAMGEWEHTALRRDEAFETDQSADDRNRFPERLRESRQDDGDILGCMLLCGMFF
jgi:hypothetical protein